MHTVQRVYKERVPRDLTTGDDALPVAEILGVSVQHRVFYLGRQRPSENEPHAWHSAEVRANEEYVYVFVYMAFPEGGPYEWLKAASQRRQASYTFSGEYVKAWRAAVGWAVAQARGEIEAEMGEEQ